jgi:hypothetical protein
VALVLDAGTGEPLSGAEIFAAPPPGDGPSPAVAATGRDGRFALAGDPARTVLVRLRGYLPEVARLRRSGPARIRLCRPGAVRGRLLDEEGAPLAGVTIRGRCAAALDAAEAATGPDGTFRLDGLRPGRWLLGPASGAAAGGTASVDVAAGATSLAVLRPRRAPDGSLC